MNHGIVDAFAYQEALFIEVIFGVVILTMIWVGFRRWLRHKEQMGRLIAERTAELTRQHGAQLELVEARLNAIEQNATVSRGTTQIEAPISRSEDSPLQS